MASLPIAHTEIVTPYVINEDEVVDILDTANHTTAVVRQGGQRFSISASLAPIHIGRDPGHFAEIDVFLAANPTFEFPVKNVAPVTLATTVTTSQARSVGDTTVTVTLGAAGQGAPVAGQFITFAGSNKIYRILSYASGGATTGTITLTKPLRQSVSNSALVTTTGTDGKGNSFSGVMGTFVNVDFGAPMHRIDDSVLARFGPFQLIEAVS